MARTPLLQIDTGPEQYVTTALVGVLLVVFLYGLYRGGRPLKRRYDDNLVEILQAFAATIAAVAASLFVVAVWRLEETVEAGVEQITVGPETAVLLLVTGVVLAVTYTLTRVTKRLVRYGSGRVSVTPHQREVVHHAVQLVLFFAATAFIFALWAFDPRNLLIGAGALGIVFGFAARKTLSGVLAGFVILFGRPFEIGDWIAVGDREGIVTTITVYNTQLRTFNEEHVLIPNDTVTESEVVNYSKTNQLRLVSEVGVDYDANLDHAATVAREAMDSCDSVVDSPEPDVVLESFADSAVVLTLRYWIDDPSISRKHAAKDEVLETVKEAFDDEGITIPYPQRELTARPESGGFRITSNDSRIGSDHANAGDEKRPSGDRSPSETPTVEALKRTDMENIDEDDLEANSGEER